MENDLLLNESRGWREKIYFKTKKLSNEDLIKYVKGKSLKIQERLERAKKSKSKKKAS